MNVSPCDCLFSFIGSICGENNGHGKAKATRRPQKLPIMEKVQTVGSASAKPQRSATRAYVGQNEEERRMYVDNDPKELQGIQYMHIHMQVKQAWKVMTISGAKIGKSSTFILYLYLNIIVIIV